MILLCAGWGPDFIKIQRRIESRSLIYELSTLKTINIHYCTMKSLLKSQLTIVECDNGTMKAEFCVTEEHLNERGYLHGGLIMTLIDSISTRALMSNERNTPRGVSVELSTSFLRAAAPGDTVEVLAKTLKTGKILGFLEVQVRNKCTHELLAVGKHTKFITP